MSDRWRVLSGLAAEVAIAVLPLLVVLFVVMQAKHWLHFFASPEWSFGAAIFFGQALVKFASALVRGKGAATGPVALTVALLVVFGLVPSLLVLAMTLQAVEAEHDPGFWLEAGQVVLFCGAAAVYMLLGTVAETFGKSKKEIGSAQLPG